MQDTRLNSEELAPGIQKTVRWFHQSSFGASGLGLPALLFVAGHQPISFVAGQALYLLDPLGKLCGTTAISDWAELLSAPGGAHLLEQYLREHLTQNSTGTFQKGER